MSVMDVDVSRFSLTISARDTMHAVLESGDIERGARLDEALDAAGKHHGTDAHAVPPSARLSEDDFRPGFADVWPYIGGRSESEILRNLEEAGFVELATVWHDTDGDAYLDEGRILTAVRVLRPFAVVQVAYRRKHASFLDYPDHWEIDDRTPVVGAGTYVVAEVGDFRMTYVGATGIDTAHDNDRGIDLDTLTCWAVENEGFLASLCLAECGECGGRWMAEEGSWRFRPTDGSEVDPFYFDEADDHDGDTIACPDCETGRVGFLVC